MHIPLSAVVNTCCLGPRADSVFGSSGHVHARRVSFMRELILPTLCAQCNQVIVSGEFEQGADYEYQPSPSQFFDCRDVLAQRQAGFQLAKHEWILFQMDDHIVDTTFVTQLQAFQSRWDIVSPARLSYRDRRELNSGWNDPRPECQTNPYIHTHAIVMKRSAVAACPWSALPPIRHFDVAHSARFREAGLQVTIAKQLRVFDLEE